jgi:hypothetical protein
LGYANEEPGLAKVPASMALSSQQRSERGDMIVPIADEQIHPTLLVNAEADSMLIWQALKVRKSSTKADHSNLIFEKEPN